MSKKKLIASGGVLAILIAAAIAVYFIFFYIPYNAVLYESGNDLVLDSFYQNNKIATWYYYPNPDYDPSVGNYERTYETIDRDQPQERTYIIKDAETYAKIFKEGAIEVDFDREMLLLYIFADCYDHRGDDEYSITDVSLSGGELTVSYMYTRWTFFPSGGSVATYARCFVVKMDKLDVDGATFVEK